MLLGGDKTGKWNRWYPRNIERAKRLYDEHEREHRKGASLSEPTRSGKDVVSEEPVNEMRARLYQRLMEAQERIAHARHKRGVSHETVLAALDTADERLSENEQREDLYLSVLAHYVEALGGRVEVRAVFADESIVVRREPAD
jgi:pyruvate/2-oxoglutarate dehydrogenase complex dihydrolipoamide acyltransferase (E2) component